MMFFMFNTENWGKMPIFDDHIFFSKGGFGSTTRPLGGAITSETLLLCERLAVALRQATTAEEVDLVGGVIFWGMI